MPTALAISPHLDDAVFSAGGTLRKLVRNGWRVVVATVFSASVSKPRGFALSCQLDKGIAASIDYMALRRQEDAAACAVLGATPIWLPFVEAPHRGYDSAAALFAGLRPDDSIVADISPVIAALAEDVSPDVVLVPQCIGAHVDHIAVYLALRECGHQPLYWVDFPYASRLNGRPSPFHKELAAHPRSSNVLSADELAAKLEAVVCYASQLGFQFGGASAATDAIRSFGLSEGFACPEATCGRLYLLDDRAPISF